MDDMGHVCCWLGFMSATFLVSPGAGAVLARERAREGMVDWHLLP